MGSNIYKLSGLLIDAFIMKNILIIHTGGTFGMNPVRPGKTLQPGDLENAIEKYIPNFESIANITIVTPFNLDSSDIGPEEWMKTFEIVMNHKDNYDGFVIIHGTDTLVYNATSMSYLTTGLNKPVIFTGSQRPLSKLRTDATSNLINSVELATYPMNEVGIYFGNNLFRANRTKKMSIESFLGFDSPNYPPLASVGLKINLHQKNLLNEIPTISLNPVFDTNILNIKVFPGLDPGCYENIIQSKTKAIIIEGFGAGNLPSKKNNWIPFIEKYVKRKKIVIIGSQSAHGNIDLELYKSGKDAQDAGALSLRDMTFEAALVKLMLLLGNFSDIEMVRQFFNVSIAGEITLQ